MNIPIYPGSSSFYPGQTPFGFYDYDYQFQTDADKVVTFCARRLGYPIMEVELQDLNFYAAFEESITTYGNELYAFQVRDNLLNVIGSPTASNMNHAIVTPSMAGVIRLTQQYGEEAGVGGNLTWYSGSFTTKEGVQDYDFNLWAIENNVTGGMEIKRVFYYPPPAVNQVYNLSIFSGLGGVPAVGSYGLFGSTGFLMYPTSLLLQSAQAVEMQNEISLNNYSFELINNKLRIFPIPYHNDHHIWFQYISIEERNNSVINNSSNSAGSVTNPSNANFTNPVYGQINSIGRQWIFEYTLALCKEMLGYVRGKYQSTIPIPNREISLNSADLITAATAEKNALVERLRGYLDETSRQALLARKQAEGDSTMNELGRSPMTIFIG
jgi:hypothetical protein